MSMTQGTNTLLFSYDASGKVIAVNFNGTYYYYLRNGQGDIVKLIDNSGAAVVEYLYDTWGKQFSCTGSLASTLGALNPFRYRGYVYDEETQWYYLQSRYYDPETGRFISADVMLSTGQGVLGHNTFAYCLNNPVNMADTNGIDAIWIQEGESAKGMGHTGLMVQDENGDWYYFYWGPYDESAPIIQLIIGVEANIILEKINTLNIDLESIASIREAIQQIDNINPDRITNISSIFYFEGDYSQTFDYLFELKNTEKDNLPKYKLFSNNCVQVTTQALKNSNWIFGLVGDDYLGILIPNQVVGNVALVPRCKDNYPWALLYK